MDKYPPGLVDVARINYERMGYKRSFNECDIKVRKAWIAKAYACVEWVKRAGYRIEKEIE